LILAAVSPDNTPHGYNWTFVYPMLLFIVIGGVLYYLFGRPHRRVPPRLISVSAAGRTPDPSAARAASVAGGMSVAAGGGATESHLEPHGAHLAASAEASGEDAGAEQTVAGGTPAAETTGAEAAGGDATAEHTGAPE
jgi:hypothetical protein